MKIIMKLSLIIMAVASLTLVSNSANAGHDSLVVGKSYTDQHIAVCDSIQSLPKLMSFIQDFPSRLTLPGAKKLAEESGCSFERQLFTIRENVCSFARNGILAFSVVKAEVVGIDSVEIFYSMVNMIPNDMMVKCNEEMLNGLPNIE